MTPEPSTASVAQAKDICNCQMCNPPNHRRVRIYCLSLEIAAALDIARRDGAREEALRLANELVAQYQDGKRDGTRETWEAAYQEFDYMIRSRSLWTEATDKALKDFRRARAAALETEAPHE